MRRLRLLAGLALLSGAGTQAQDLERGKLLYDTHCNECHYERVHQRLRSDIKDIGELREEVARRALETKRRTFSFDELDDIAEYLNASHYRFGAATGKKR